MFNPLAPHELIAALGRVLREAAEPALKDDDYVRSQLLSASSIARHLAAEEDAAPTLQAWLREALLQVLEGEEATAAQAARAKIAVAASGPEIGAALAAMFDELGPGDAELRSRVQHVLAEMSDREVAALARA